jgi:uncharacterized protein (TIGR02266 family)
VTSSSTEDVVYVVEDSEPVRELVMLLLGQLGCKPVAFGSVETCLEALRGSPAPALILMSHDMPGTKGDEGCRLIKETPEWTSIPVVMMTAPGAGQQVMRAWRAAADDFLSKPIRKPQLQTKLRGILQSSNDLAASTARRTRHRLLFVEDDRFFRFVLGTALEHAGFHLLYARDGEEALTLIDAHGGSIDACMTDLVMPKTDGLAVLKKLLSDPRFEGKPAFAMTTLEPNAPQVVQAQELTGTQVLDKRMLPVDVMVSKVNTALQRVAVNLRVGERVPFFQVVPFKDETSAEWIEGFTYDVSTGGLFLKTATPAAAGSSVELKIGFGDGPPAIAKALVAWSNPFRRRLTFSYPVGMGLQFTQLDPEEKKRLVKLVKSKPSETQAAARTESHAS